MWFESPVTGRSLDARSLVLSFDDGPGPDTVELACYLAEENIQAIFFAVGKCIRERPHALNRVLELGHLVGNHTQNHVRLTDCSVSDREACAEFTEMSGALRELHVTESFFRPPYGSWNRHTAHIFGSNPAICLGGTGPVNWDINGDDYVYWRERRGVDACAESYMTAIKRRKRGVVLFHDFSADGGLAGAPNRTLKMVRILIPRLRDEGYRFSSANDIPEWKAASCGGLRCRLRSGKTGRSPVGRLELVLFPVGQGAVRLESPGGLLLWPRIEMLPLPGNTVAFRTPDNLMLAYDLLTCEIKAASTAVNERSTFCFTSLGPARPKPSGASGNVGSL